MSQPARSMPVGLAIFFPFTERPEFLVPCAHTHTHATYSNTINAPTDVFLRIYQKSKVDKMPTLFPWVFDFK